jgi:threonine synthase
MELYEWGWIKKIPRVLVVNATGANTFYQLVNGLFEETKLTWNAGKVNTDLIDRFYREQQEKNIVPKTQATAIQIGKPANIIKALRTIEFTNGIVEQVADLDMMDGMTIVGLNGFDCEMASGSVPAGVMKLRDKELIKKDEVPIKIFHYSKYYSSSIIKENKIYFYWKSSTIV